MTNDVERPDDDSRFGDGQVGVTDSVVSVIIRSALFALGLPLVLL